MNSKRFPLYRSNEGDIKMVPQLKIKRMYDDVILPKYESEGAAAFDIRAYINGYASKGFLLWPDQKETFHTGLKIEIPKGYAGVLRFEKSSLGVAHNIHIVSGLIDSDYRGEILIRLWNVSETLSFKIENGDKIAQMVILETPQVEIIEVNELSETIRGEKGFGSTGK